MTSHGISLAGHGKAMELHDQDGMELQDRTLAGQGQTKEATMTIGDVLAEDSSLEVQDDENMRTSHSTRKDADAMKRMGKDQVLIRQFRLLSISSFVAIAMATWEIGLFTISQSFVDGGRPGLIWSTFWNFICFTPIYLSMAEMASMAPIAGAQYHWVSEFAPENCQRFLSYITGWTSTLAWQSGNAVGIFLVGSLIQCIISVNNENYGFPAWQCTLLAFAAMLIAYCGSVYGSKALPYWQNAVFAVHIMAYFAYIVPIWVSAPTATHSQVWTEFTSEGGWSTMGLSVLIGQLTGISQQVGLDTAAHMSEEVRNASASIPKAMLYIYICNFVLMFPAFLTVCYHVPDIDAALSDSTTYPAIYVLRQSMSPAWVTVVLVIIVILNIASNIVYLTAVSRDLFAFARDKGLPFSKWLSVVHPTRKIPQNASTLSCGIAICLALIYVGSPVAFYAINSLLTVALLQCYCVSIGCVLWRRIYHPATLPPSEFALGKWGVPVNALAVLYSFFAFFWCFWPQATPVTASGFNWSSPIFVAVLVIAMVYFVFKARFHYVVWRPIPIAVGVAFLGAFQLYRIQQRERRKEEEEWRNRAEHPEEYETTGLRPKRRKRIVPSGPWSVQIMSTIPLKALSRYWGWFNSLDIPYPLRVPGFKLYGWIFGVNFDEVAEPDLHTYRNLAQFFYRTLKPGVRPIDADPTALVSPADGRVVQFGLIEHGEVEQVKGVTYHLDALLGTEPTKENEVSSNVTSDARSPQPSAVRKRSGDEESIKADEEFAQVNGISYTLPNLLSGPVSSKPGKHREGGKLSPNVAASDQSTRPHASSEAAVQAELASAQKPWYYPSPKDTEDSPTALYYCVVYLAPGDYHRFHSPASWVVQSRRHFAGELYSVSPYLVRTLPGLFTLNERVVLLGKWKYGFFSYTPVGATNVGSIIINFDRELRTNSLLTDTAADRAAEQAQERGEPYSGYAEATYTGASPVLGGHALKKGEEMGGFQLGSTIVMVFEAPKGRRPTFDEGWEMGREGRGRTGGWKWCIEKGMKVQVGEKLGFVEGGEE
ncbi:hypothetical protein B0A55_06609 [Friedmanniomyces simplex]|uniref:Phosphatidylserine decarboxylase proenzyme 1, mitochondrial n=1 Tax=Friedmanniomyces simplex TaxID=329884 RepID=A0A4U0X1A8_9PEZI|nr:hypothetical protein B0A55_06609 [Friedmanniomyces simplex]